MPNRSWHVIEGDCVEQMARMDEASVDAVVCDPPYGLEFMGKDWDAFRIDDTGTARHRGDRAGSHGDTSGTGSGYRLDGGRTKSRVAIGGGKRPATNRCVECGKRDQFRNPHDPCGEGVWRAELIDPHAAPPTMLAFQEWSRIWALEAKRILKPGGHLLAFGGTRTSHRLACAIEDAGFEIRDTICWMYGSGFPKSLQPRNGMLSLPRSTRREDYARWWHDVRTTATGTALKPAHEPIVVARKPLAGTVAGNVLAHGTGALNVNGCRVEGTIEQGHTRGRNALGVLNDDGWTPSQNGQPIESHPAGRWPANVVLDPEAAEQLDQSIGPRSSGSRAEGVRSGLGYHGANGDGGPAIDGSTGPVSRFFANFDHEEDPWHCPNGHAITAEPCSCPRSPSADSARVDAATSASRAATSQLRPEPSAPCPGSTRLPGDSTPSPSHARDAADQDSIGITSTTPAPTSSSGSVPAATHGSTESDGTVDDGGLSGCRFRYEPKASSAERNAGLDGFEAAITDDGRNVPIDNPYLRGETTRRNVHPTVKPIALMRWLVRLVTPPGGLVLDPFAGSGTTGCAAMLEGFRFVGIERDPGYVPIARARIGWWAEHPEGMELVERLEAEKARRAVVESGQLGLFG